MLYTALGVSVGYLDIYFLKILHPYRLNPDLIFGKNAVMPSESACPVSYLKYMLYYEKRALVLLQNLDDLYHHQVRNENMTCSSEFLSTTGKSRWKRDSLALYIVSYLLELFVFAH